MRYLPGRPYPSVNWKPNAKPDRPDPMQFLVRRLNRERTHAAALRAFENSRPKQNENETNENGNGTNNRS